MSDLRDPVRDVLDRLGADVVPGRLPAPGRVRGDADRARRAGTLGLAAALAAVAVVVAVLVTSLAGRRGDDAARPVSSGPDSVLPQGSWLPDPWRLVADQATTLGAAATSGDGACGVAARRATTPVVRQDLTDGDRALRVYGVSTASFGDAADLFKELYATCSAVGPVASEPGPSLRWGTGAQQWAAVWHDVVVLLVVSDSGASPDDLRDVVTDLVGVWPQAAKPSPSD